MDKGKIEAMVTKFSEKFAIIMLKKHRKFCRRGWTHFDATPIFKKIVQIHMVHPVYIQGRNRKLFSFVFGANENSKKSFQN